MANFFEDLLNSLGAGGGRSVGESAVGLSTLGLLDPGGARIRGKEFGKDVEEAAQAGRREGTKTATKYSWIPGGAEGTAQEGQNIYAGLKGLAEGTSEEAARMKAEKNAAVSSMASAAQKAGVTGQAANLAQQEIARKKDMDIAAMRQQFRRQGLQDIADRAAKERQLQMVYPLMVAQANVAGMQTPQQGLFGNLLTGLSAS